MITDENILTVGLLIIAFIFLFITGLIERFAMIGAALVCVFLAIEGWVLTATVFVPAIFILLMAVCIGISITERV